MTLSEISAWAREQTGWGPSLSGITNRARRHGWAPRQQRCPLYPDPMLRAHLRDHYTIALRAEAKVRRGDILSPNEAERLGQASAVIRSGMVLAYTFSDGFHAVPRRSGMPQHEWLTWWQDFEGLDGAAPVSERRRDGAIVEARVTAEPGR